MKRSLIIFSHGSRSSESIDEFNKVVDAVRKRNVFDYVEGAFLQFAGPDINDAAASLISRETDEIVVMPYFLFKGVHISRDLSGLLDALRKKYPAVTFRQTRPIGFEPVMVDIILQRADETEQDGEDK